MKKLLVTISVLITVLLLAIILFPFLFKNKLVEIVKKQANQNINATVNFDNDINLSLIKNFPNLTLGIKELSIVGIDDFEGDTLIAWNNFEATIDVMSVIRGDQITVRKILLESPTINALVLSNGRANWDITKADTTDASSPDTTQTKFNLSLKKLELKNANISYNDKVMGVSTQLAGMDYDMSGDFTQDVFDLKILSNIKQFNMAYGGVKYLNKVNTNIKIDLGMNMPESKYTFKENSISLNELTFNFDGFVQMLNEDIVMDLKYGAEKATFKSFLSLVPGAYTQNFADVKTDGTMAFNGFAKGTYNEKTLPAFALNLVVGDAMFQYPSLPVAVKDIHIKLAITNSDGNLNNTVVDLSKFHMDVAGDAFDARLVAKNIMQDPHVDSWLKGKIDLASISKIAPLEEGMNLTGTITTDVTAVGKVSDIENQKYESFNAKGEILVQNVQFKSKNLPQGFSLNHAYLNFSPKVVALKSFDAQIGKSDININGELSNFFPYLFSNGVLNGKLSLNSNLIDANQFISAEPEGTSPATEDTSSLIAPEIPANINFVFSSNIKQLLYSNIDITDFAGALVVQNQKLSFNNIDLNTLGASIKMNGFYETTNPNKPTTNIDFGIANLDFQKAFKSFNTVKKLAPIAENMFGTFSTNLSLTTTLDNHLNPIYPTLFANGKLNIPNAEIKDVKLFNKVAEVLKNDKYRSVGLKNVNIAFKVENGIIYTEPFDVNVGGKKMSLYGSTGLDQTIDYRGITDVKRAELGAVNTALETALASLNTKAGSNIKMDENISVALVIGGTFTNPKISTNLADIGKQQANSLKDQAADELARQKKLLEDRARAEADKAKAEAERLKKETEAKVKSEADKAKQKAQAEADRIKKDVEQKVAEDKERLKKQAEEEAKKKLQGIFKKP
jgi:uncharacterized protein involved in outer membrane biogenesis